MCIKSVQVDGMERVYITSKLKQEEKLCRTRDGVSHDLRADDCFEKVDPHITIVPPFYIDEGERSMVHNKLERIDIEDTEVNINHLKVWPNLGSINYIMLDVDADIRDEQFMLADSFRDDGAELIKTPVEPHITLLKRKRKRDSSPYWLKRRVQDMVGTCTGLGSTRIDEVKPIFGD